MVINSEDSRYEHSVAIISYIFAKSTKVTTFTDKQIPFEIPQQVKRHRVAVCLSLGLSPATYNVLRFKLINIFSKRL